MKFKGNYNFYVDGKSVTVEDVFDLVTTDMTASIKGLDVFYSSPKKEKLEMAQKFKEKALEEMGIKDTESKKQSSQSYYTNAEQYEILYKICMEQIEQLIEKESRIQDSQEPRQLQFDSIESNSEDALRKAYGDLANIFKNEDGNYQINFPQKKNKTEELLEEVNKHQEQNGGRDVNMEFPFETPTKKYNNASFVPGFGFIPKRGEIFKYDKIAEKENTKEAKKETEGKLFYELDFEFIKQMAERMQSNKDNNKYELWNWKKPMTPRGIEALKQAMWRHIIAVMQGEFEDDGREFGHLEAISNNAMMINYQLKNKS
jgi:hypothetical protein